MTPVRLILPLLLALLSRSLGPAGRTLVAVFAHPDDELVVGPLLAAEARQGVTVYLVIVTAGEHGNAHTQVPAGPELARVRTDEARCSARALGIEPPIVLGYGDGELGHFERPAPAYLARLATELGQVIARLKPDAIITFGPEGLDGHPDHRLVGAVVSQLVQAGVPGIPAALFYPGFPADQLSGDLGSGAPWLPTDTAFMPVRVPYLPVDVAATRAAFGCHKTQVSPEEIDADIKWYEDAFRGRVYLRPWFGRTENLFDH